MCLKASVRNMILKFILIRTQWISPCVVYILTFWMLYNHAHYLKKKKILYKEIDTPKTAVPYSYP